MKRLIHMEATGTKQKPGRRPLHRQDGGRLRKYLQTMVLTSAVGACVEAPGKEALRAISVFVFVCQAGGLAAACVGMATGEKDKAKLRRELWKANCPEKE